MFPHTTNQPAKSDAYALAATPDTVDDDTIQLSHGTSFTRSTIHIHVNVAKHPSSTSRPPLAQDFSHVPADVAFQSTASVEPRPTTSFQSLKCSAIVSTLSTFTCSSTGPTSKKTLFPLERNMRIILSLFNIRYSMCSCGCATAYELQVWMMKEIVSTRCFELFPLRVSDVGSHCDLAEAFTNRDMTERTMQISLWP